MTFYATAPVGARSTGAPASWSQRRRMLGLLLRIFVPLAFILGVSGAAQAQTVSQHGGLVVKDPKIFLINLETAGVAQDHSFDTIADFTRKIGGSQWFSVLEEYGVHNNPNMVVAQDTWVTTTPGADNLQTFAQIFQDHYGVVGDNNAVFVIATDDGFPQDCGNNCGAKHDFASNALKWAWIPHAHGNTNALTVFVQHELAEIFTDPYNSGWYKPQCLAGLWCWQNETEIADFCGFGSGQPLAFASFGPGINYQVQPLWSNRYGCTFTSFENDDEFVVSTDGNLWQSTRYLEEGADVVKPDQTQWVNLGNGGFPITSDPSVAWLGDPRSGHPDDYAVAFTDSSAHLRLMHSSDSATTDLGFALFASKPAIASPFPGRIDMVVSTFAFFGTPFGLSHAVITNGVISAWDNWTPTTFQLGLTAPSIAIQSNSSSNGVVIAVYDNATPPNLWIGTTSNGGAPTWTSPGHPGGAPLTSGWLTGGPTIVSSPTRGLHVYGTTADLLGNVWEYRSSWFNLSSIFNMFSPFGPPGAVFGSDNIVRIGVNMGVGAMYREDVSGPVGSGVTGPLSIDGLQDPVYPTERDIPKGHGVVVGVRTSNLSIFGVNGGE